MVIGGNGFLGRHIVQQLLDRGDIVSVFDIVERYNDVSFYAGDISEQESVASALRKVLPLTITFCELFIHSIIPIRAGRRVSYTQRHLMLH